MYNKGDYLEFNSIHKGMKVLLNKKTFATFRYNNTQFSGIEELLLDKDVEDIMLNNNDVNVTPSSLIKKYNENILNVTILNILDCNFRCTYCYEEFSDEKLDFKNGKKIVDFIIKQLETKESYKILNIFWFGGEPTLNIDIIEKISEILIKYCYENDIEYRGNITTNGYELSQENYQKLKLAKVDNYQITVDGTKDIHNKYRAHKDGSGTYQAIERNVKRIVEKNDNSTIFLRTNVSKELFENYKEYVDYLVESYEKYENIFFDFHWINNLDSDCKKTYNVNIFDIMEYTATKSSRLLPISSRFIPAFACPVVNENSIVIKPNGDIVKCTVALDDPDFNIGNIENMIVRDLNYDCDGQQKCMSCGFVEMCRKGSCGLYYVKNKDGKCVWYKYNKLLKQAISIMERQNLINVELQ